MADYRKGLLERPPRIAALPLNEKGYPIPWFVEYVDGKPDFRIMDGKKWQRAVKEKRCWICGEPLGINMTFLAGPMCGINRISSEPPSHFTCATYAAQACPFLTLPKALRREANMPEGVKESPGGIMLPRNPGVTMLWVSDYYVVHKVSNGVLIEIGEPIRVEWFAEGRKATRAEVEESVRTGLPALQKLADEDGPKSQCLLIEKHEHFKKFLPAEEVPT